MNPPAFPRPLPAWEGDAERYWQALANDRIELPRCEACSAWVFPPRPFCPRCHASEVSWQPVSGSGRVYTMSVVHRATHPWFLDKTPYVYAVVELDIGVRLPSTIVGCAPGEVSVGMPVEPVFESVGEGHKLLFFRPRQP